MTENAGPDYLRVYDGIRGKVSSGGYPVGTPIPSTPELEKQYGVSKTPVRQAVDLLKREGVLDGHPGKRVYVKALPAAAAADMRDLKALGEDVAELKRRAAGYEDLREIVNRLEYNLIELYGKVGHNYPTDEASNGRQERTARHG